jgi:hypothetical protein
MGIMIVLLTCAQVIGIQVDRLEHRKPKLTRASIIGIRSSGHDWQIYALHELHTFLGKMRTSAIKK